MKDMDLEEAFPALFDRMIDHEGMDYNEVIAKIVDNNHIKLANRMIYSGCLLGDGSDCNQIINAHSIQNNGILSELAEGGKVVLIDDTVSDITNKKTTLVGRNEATTFRGFCKKHDECFNAIEHRKYEYGNSQQNFLFAYRAFAKVYTDNLTASNFYDKWLGEIVNNNSLERILEKQKNAAPKKIREMKKKVVLKRQEFRQEQLKALNKEFEEIRISMNINLSRERYFKLETILVEVDVQNTIACSCVPYIAMDLNGYVFNHNLKYPSFLTIIPQGNVTVVLLSFFKRHKSHFRNFINQITSASKEEKELIISNILLKYGDNIVFSPTQFNKFNKRALDVFAYGFNNRTQYPGEKLIRYPINLFRPAPI